MDAPIPVKDTLAKNTLAEILEANKCPTHLGVVCTYRDKGLHIKITHPNVVFWVSMIVSAFLIYYDNYLNDIQDKNKWESITEPPPILLGNNLLGDGPLAKA